MCQKIFAPQIYIESDKMGLYGKFWDDRQKSLDSVMVASYNCCDFIGPAEVISNIRLENIKKGR